MLTKYISNSDHYKEVLSYAKDVKSTLWIGTADIKDLYILSAWDSLDNSDRYRRLYQRIFAIEFSILRIGEYPIPSIIDIVNSIRLVKGNGFAEWKNSETVKFFEDHGYKNKKQAGGYFF